MDVEVKMQYSEKTARNDLPNKIRTFHGESSRRDAACASLAV
jgi:hypothetical protein